jgi:hypothetical protein
MPQRSVLEAALVNAKRWASVLTVMSLCPALFFRPARKVSCRFLAMRHFLRTPGLRPA